MWHLQHCFHGFLVTENFEVACLLAKRPCQDNACLAFAQLATFFAGLHGVEVVCHGEKCLCLTATDVVPAEDNRLARPSHKLYASNPFGFHSFKREVAYKYANVRRVPFWNEMR